MAASADAATKALFDQDVPLLVAKTGHYPVHTGGLSLARALGRVGVPVIAMVEDRLSPLSRSRYVTSRVPPLPLDDRGAVRDLQAIAARAGSRPVTVSTDDEAAVLLAEAGPRLEHTLRLPPTPPELSRRLASKAGLAQVCAETGVDHPRTWLPESSADLREIEAAARFPVVVKNRDAFTRTTAAAVTATRVIDTPDDLREWGRGFDGTRPAIVQEFVPPQVTTNWYFQAYRCATLDRTVGFTAVKHRDFPVGRGPTTFAESRPNPHIVDFMTRLLRETGFRGIVDCDIVHDSRDDRWLLIDFNPRVGANVASCVTTRGLGPAHAAHLDLTGREIPDDPQAYGVYFRNELTDPRSVRAGGTPVAVPAGAMSVSAYWAADDPAPAALAHARHKLWRLRGRLAGGQAGGPPSAGGTGGSISGLTSEPVG